MSRVAYWFAVAWTVAVTTYMAFAPMYGERTSWNETDPSGQQIRITDSGHSTMLDVYGTRALVWLAVPLLLVGLPLLAKNPIRRRQIGTACALILFALAFLGIASIGLYYYPAAIALLLAATTARPEKLL